VSTWDEFAEQAPVLSQYLLARLDDEATGRITYVATVRKDGGPRVHPVKVFLSGGHLRLFMYPESPKGADLIRDPRYAMHAAVTPNPFLSGELAAHGTARIETDPEARALAAAEAPFAAPPPDDNTLFSLDLDLVIGAWAADGAPARMRWRAGEGPERDIGFGGRAS